MNSSSGTLLSESESFKCLIYNDVEIIRCYLEYVLGMEINGCCAEDVDDKAKKSSNPLKKIL